MRHNFRCHEEKITVKMKRRLIYDHPIVVVVIGALYLIASNWTSSFMIFTSASKVVSSSNRHATEHGWKSSVDYTIENSTTTKAQTMKTIQTMKRSIGNPVSSTAEGNTRALNAYTQHTVSIQSLTLNLFGVPDLPEGLTTTTFEEIHDEYVVSYFALNVDQALFLNSKITVTDRYLRRLRRNLEDLQDPEQSQEGFNVIITYDQQLSYSYPSDGGTLALETLATLPFLTESARNEFNTKLIDSGEITLQEIIGVSKVNYSAQSQLPTKPVSQPSTTQPINSPPPPPPPQPAPPKPTSRPVIVPISKTPTALPTNSPVPPPTNLPVDALPTARPTPTKANADANSGGISGLLVIASVMAILFIFFTINMKYCMGEYVD